MKRQRGRGRKPGGGGGHQPNRTLESAGPDIKVRGSASHIYEKYMQLSRDASTSGDRVLAESYLQHAEHYFRMLRAMQPAQAPYQYEQRFNQDFDYEDDEEGGEGEGAEAGEGFEAGGEAPLNGAPYAGGGGGDQPEFGGAYGEQQPYGAGEGGFRNHPNNRRRRNRGRFRPPGEGGEAYEGAGEPRPERAAEPQRPEREFQPRERRPRREPAQQNGEGAGPVEGFGGSAPAFVAGE